MDMKKIKRSACERCYKSRVKCEYATFKSTRCTRCTKQKKECVPRVVVRGKSGFGKDDHGMNESDLDAYRSVALFEDVPHLALHFAAASSLVKTYKSMGFKKPPTGIKWMINSLYLVSLIEKSLSLLHSATTMAVAAGVEVDVNVLNEKRCPMLAADKEKIEQEIAQRFLLDKSFGPCFILRLDTGARGVVANVEYEYFFETGASMASRMSHAPHFKLWKEFVTDGNIADHFITKLIKTFLSNAEPKQASADSVVKIAWDVYEEKETELKDNLGNKYTANLFEHGTLCADGFYVFLVIGFKNLTPKDDGAKQRYKKFLDEQALLLQVPSHPPHHLVSHDSSFSILPSFSSSDLISLGNPLLVDPKLEPMPSSSSTSVASSSTSVASSPSVHLEQNDVWEALDNTFDQVGESGWKL